MTCRPMPASDRPVRRRNAAALLSALAGVALWLGLPAGAAAEKADQQAPLAIESDRMEYDDIRKIGTFTGKVVLTKGTIIIRAERLTVREDTEGWQHGTAWGQPASFRQKRDGLNEWIEGRGRQIDYDTRTETVRLQQQATILRTDGRRVLDEIHGNDIVYRSATEFFTVQGSERQAPTAQNPSGRVRMVIQPRAPTDPAPDPATRLAPADSLSAPADR